MNQNGGPAERVFELSADERGWVVRELGGLHLSRYNTREAAFEDALHIARVSTPCRVIMKAADGHIETMLTYPLPTPMP